MNIYLIRHAQTEMNSMGRVFSGLSNISISEKGAEMAKSLAHNPIWKGIEHIYVTPLIRTHQTADMIFDKSIERTVIPGLIEMNFGDYEGHTVEEPTDDLILNKWLIADETLTFPNGDNLMKHGRLALRALMECIKDSKYENIAIVSHATTIRLMLSLLIMDSVSGFRNIPCDNCKVTKLSYEKEKLSIKCINADYRVNCY